MAIVPKPFRQLSLFLRAEKPSAPRGFENTPYQPHFFNITKKCLYIEPEQHHIAVPHFIGFAFAAHQALFFGGGE